MFLLPLFGNVAHATEPKMIGEHGDWIAYTFMENSNKVCYMVSQPKKTSGNYSKRGDVFVLVTHRPAEKSKNVFSYVSGYTYKTEENCPRPTRNAPDCSTARIPSHVYKIDHVEDALAATMRSYVQVYEPAAATACVNARKRRRVNAIVVCDSAAKPSDLYQV
ncbi:MAG: hypothetical protein V9E86_10300 [Nitrosomonas sp.]